MTLRHTWARSSLFSSSAAIAACVVCSSSVAFSLGWWGEGAGRKGGVRGRGREGRLEGRWVERVSERCFSCCWGKSMYLENECCGLAPCAHCNHNHTPHLNHIEHLLTRSNLTASRAVLVPSPAVPASSRWSLAGESHPSRCAGGWSPREVSQWSP